MEQSCSGEVSGGIMGKTVGDFPDDWNWVFQPRPLHGVAKEEDIIGIIFDRESCSHSGLWGNPQGVYPNNRC